MIKKNIIIISCIILIMGIILFFIGNHIINWLFSSQYNDYGVSHFLVVTVDETKPREFVGELDGYRIYVERFNLNKTNFRNVDAKNVPIKKAIEEKLVSIAEWKKYAWKIKKEGNKEILQFDNYEIACSNDDCIIRPLSK